MFDVYSMII